MQIQHLRSYDHYFEHISSAIGKIALFTATAKYTPYDLQCPKQKDLKSVLQNLEKRCKNGSQ